MKTANSHIRKSYKTGPGLEAVSKTRITPQGKARDGEKAEHTRERVNFEPATNTAMGRQTGF
jgi:hypothetical protein